MLTHLEFGKFRVDVIVVEQRLRVQVGLLIGHVEVWEHHWKCAAHLGLGQMLVDQAMLLLQFILCILKEHYQVAVLRSIPSNASGSRPLLGRPGLGSEQFGGGLGGGYRVRSLECF